MPLEPVAALDAVGTVVFAVSGAAVGVRRGLDLFGVLALAFVTSAFGGVTRDVLLGATPPAAVVKWQPLALAAAAGLLTFRFHAQFERLKQPVQIFDAAGLGLFAAAGAQKALEHGVDWPNAAVLGMISGVGGGMVRDVLTAQIPTVLSSEIYAVAALAAGLVVSLGARFSAPSLATSIVGVLLCFSLRLLSIYRGWRLPVARTRDP